MFRKKFVRLRSGVLFGFVSALMLAACAPGTPQPTLVPTLPSMTAQPSATRPPNPTAAPSATVAPTAAFTSTPSAPTVTVAPTTVATDPASGEGPVYDIRINPIAVLASYADAINRRDYRRAYDYWQNPPNGQTFEQFVQGFTETVAVNLVVGPPPRLEGAAGSVYASIPTVLEATQTDGNLQLFAGCYVARRDNVSGSNNASSSNPEQNPWVLYDATLNSVPVNSEVMALLDEACPPGPQGNQPYEDQSTPARLLASYYDAINRKDYSRAYGYWRTPEVTLEEFTRGFANTDSGHIAINPVMQFDAAAGSQYASVSSFLHATQTNGGLQNFSGCIVARRTTPGISEKPEDQVWQIYSAHLEPLRAASDIPALLAQACPAP